MSSPKPIPANRFAAYTDLLRLDQDKFNELLALREKSGEQPEEFKGRAWRRLRIAGQLWVPAEITSSNGDVQLYRAYPIDISSGGISIFLGLYIHTGSPIDLKLQMLNGEWIPARGKCVRCVYLSGRAHEIGIRFNEPFDTALLLPPEVRAELGAIEESSNEIVAAAKEAQIALSVPPGSAPASSETAGASIELKAIAQELLDAVEKSSVKLRRIAGKTASADATHK